MYRKLAIERQDNCIQNEILGMDFCFSAYSIVKNFRRIKSYISDKCILDADCCISIVKRWHESQEPAVVLRFLWTPCVHLPDSRPGSPSSFLLPMDAVFSFEIIALAVRRGRCALISVHCVTWNRADGSRETKIREKAGKGGKSFDWWLFVNLYCTVYR